MAILDSGLGYGCLSLVQTFNGPMTMLGGWVDRVCENCVALTFRFPRPREQEWRNKSKFMDHSLSVSQPNNDIFKI